MRHSPHLYWLGTQFLALSKAGRRLVFSRRSLENGDHLCISPDSRTLVVGGHLSGLSVWDLSTLKKTGSFIGEGVTTLALSPDGKTVACGHRFTKQPVVLRVRLSYSTQQMENKLTVLQLLSSVESIDFHPDGETIGILCTTDHPMTASPDSEYIQELVIWDTTGKRRPIRKRGAISQLGVRFFLKGSACWRLVFLGIRKQSYFLHRPIAK